MIKQKKGTGLTTIWINIYIESVNEHILLYLKNICKIEMMIQLLKKSKELDVDRIDVSEIYCADDDGNLCKDHALRKKLNLNQKNWRISSSKYLHWIWK